MSPRATGESSYTLAFLEALMASLRERLKPQRLYQMSINGMHGGELRPQQQSFLPKRKRTMPTGPKGQKRPADVVGNAIMVARIATGEIEEGTPADDGKDPAAVSMGKRGGAARAKSMTPARRAEIAKAAAAKRWAKPD